jgi:hypothetical protein
MGDKNRHLEMKMNLKIYTLLIFLLHTAIVMAQNFHQQKQALHENRIILKNTICIIYNNGKQVDSFFSASTSFNKLGYPLQHTVFKKTGTLEGKFISEYEFDSLEIKETAFDSTGNFTIEQTNQYDAGGRIKSMKVRFSNPGKKPVSHYFETDSIAHTIKDYGFSEDEKKLIGIREFNNNWQLTASTSFDSEGKAKYKSLYEYDPVNHTRKDFSVKDGIKKLRSEKKYTTGNFLTEEIHYYSNNVTLNGGDSPAQNFKKGDTRKVLFLYDSRGLLQEQQEIVNDEITMRLRFDYLK